MGKTATMILVACAVLSVVVGHREGRIDPRKNKRRPKLIALMIKPRSEYQAEMKAAA